MRVVRSRSSFVRPLLFLVMLLAAAPAAAQQPAREAAIDWKDLFTLAPAPVVQPLRAAVPDVATTDVVQAVRPADADAEQPIHIQLVPVRESKRPAALLPLYGSLVVLQGLDIHSTRKGMSSGRTREANPLMESVVKNGAAFVAVKAASTAGTIWLSERLWKKNRRAAIILTTAINGAMAAVVAHNYRIAK